MSGRSRKVVGLALALTAGGSVARAADECPGAPAATADAKDVDRTCVSDPTPASKLAAELDVLKTPDTPAAEALGLTATEIQRPTTPTAAAVAVATGLAKGLLVPGQNLALEISPYWLWSHPHLTATELENQGVGASIDSSLSFSLATAAAKDSTTAGVMAPAAPNDVGQLAVGVRATPLRGKPSEAALLCADRIERYTADLALDLSRTLDAKTTEWKAAHPEPKAGPARERWLHDRTAVRDEFKTAWKAKLDAMPSDVADCVDVSQHRVGVLVDVAGAATWTAPGWDFTKVSQTGNRDLAGWLTFGYSYTTGPPQSIQSTSLDLSFLGLFRVHWIDDYAMKQSRATVDAGGRIVFAWSRYGASVQYVHIQGALEDAMGVRKNSDRVGLVGDYHLKSGIWATGVIAADLSDPSKLDSWSGWRGIVSLQGNFGRDRQLAADSIK
jgi:hypothetical protein